MSSVTSMFGIFRGLPARSTRDFAEGRRNDSASNPPVGQADPPKPPETHRFMHADDRASARHAKWGQPREPDPQPIAWWPEDFDVAPPSSPRSLEACRVKFANRP